MNNLINLGITNKNNKAVVSSRIVAEKFLKEHNDLKKRIRELIKGLEDVGEKSHIYFIYSSYKDTML